MSEQCKFCKLLEKPEENPRWIATFPNSVVFVYKDQTYKGRTVVILKHHVEQLTELPSAEGEDFYSETIQVAKAIQKAINPERLNYANLGNEVPHLHWHIIPRFPNDHNHGDPPWPAPAKYLSDEEYQILAKQIRSNLK